MKTVQFKLIQYWGKQPHKATGNMLFLPQQYFQILAVKYVSDLFSYSLKDQIVCN